MYLALINLLISLVEHGPDGVRKIIADLKQKAELTDEQSAAFDARMEAAFASDAWKTDDQL